MKAFSHGEIHWDIYSVALGEDGKGVPKKQIHSYPLVMTNITVV